MGGVTMKKFLIILSVFLVFPVFAFAGNPADNNGKTSICLLNISEKSTGYIPVFANGLFISSMAGNTYKKWDISENSLRLSVFLVPRGFGEKEFPIEPGKTNYFFVKFHVGSKFEFGTLTESEALKLLENATEAVPYSNFE
jgi:hypothetical protein